MGDSALTVFGGKGFVLGEYVAQYYHPAIGNIASVNDRDDYVVYSSNVLYGISTIHNFHIFTDVHIDINTNLNVLMDVLENWRKYQELTGIRGTFNYLSSWLVYGNQDNIPVPETAECNPSGLYSITKRCAEQMLISYCTTYGLNWRILRLSNVVGLGDNKVSAQKNGLQYMINNMANGKDVEIYGDGKFYRDFTHVSDVATAIDLVLSKGRLNETYNIGNGKGRMFGDIILYAREQLKTSGVVRFVEPKEFQKQVVVQTFYMDNSKLLTLGYTPKYMGEKLYDSIIPHVAGGNQCSTS